MNEKLITVTGEGAIHVVPDVTCVELTLQSIHDTYEDAYAQAKSNTEWLSQIMGQFKTSVESHPSQRTLRRLNIPGTVHSVTL